MACSSSPVGKPVGPETRTGSPPSSRCSCVHRECPESGECLHCRGSSPWPPARTTWARQGGPWKQLPHPPASCSNKTERGKRKGLAKPAVHTDAELWNNWTLSCHAQSLGCLPCSLPLLRRPPPVMWHGNSMCPHGRGCLGPARPGHVPVGHTGSTAMCSLALQLPRPVLCTCPGLWLAPCRVPSQVQITRFCRPQEVHSGE